MAVSVTQRPASWVPSGNPILYKFTVTGGPYTNYRIEIKLKRSGGSNIGSVLSFSPNNGGIVTADISAIIRSYLIREFEYVTAVNSTEDTVGSVRFYIEYKEVYTGSVTGFVSDIANQFNAVIASLQIPNNADLSDYVIGSSIKKFLSILVSPKYFRGYPFDLSMLLPSGLTSPYRSVSQKDSSGSVITSNLDLLVYSSSNQNALNRLTLPIIDSKTKSIDIKIVAIGGSTANNPSNNDFATSITGWTEDSSLGGTKNWDWNIGSYSYARAGLPGNYLQNSGDKSTILYNTIATIPAGQIIRVTVRASTDYANSVVIRLYGSTTVGSGWILLGLATLTNGLPVINIIQNTAAVNIGVIGMECEAILTTAIKSAYVDYILVDKITLSDLSETKTLSVIDQCKNPVYLVWKNSLGGDSFYMFYYGQEDYFTYDNGRKAKRQVLYAEGLSYNEWESINELNTPGERYQVAIPELTTSVNKTGKRTDQQVYVIDTDGNKTGVIVIPRSTSARTDKKIHSISIEIEYPTIYL